MQKVIRSFVQDNSGATAIEYALLGSFLALALIVALTNLGARLSSEFSEISTALK